MSERHITAYNPRCPDCGRIITEETVPGCDVTLAIVEAIETRMYEDDVSSDNWEDELEARLESGHWRKRQSSFEKMSVSEFPTTVLAVANVCHWPMGSLQWAMANGDKWRRKSWADHDVYILRNSGAVPLWSFGGTWGALADDLISLDWEAL